MPAIGKHEWIIAEDPALRKSGTVVEVEQKDRGTYLTVGSPIKFSDLTPVITGAPLLGEHRALSRAPPLRTTTAHRPA